MDTNHFFCKIERSSQAENNNSLKEIFNNLKKNLAQNDPKLIPNRKSIFSLNYNVKNQLDIKISENKSESKEKEEQNISKLKNNQVKKNNYFKSISSTFQKKDENNTLSLR